MRRTRAVIFIALALSVAWGMFTPAEAAKPPTAGRAQTRLDFYASKGFDGIPTAAAGWLGDTFSSDGDGTSIRLVTTAQGDGTTTPYSYAVVTAVGSGIEGKHLSEVTNLSFDREGFVAGGAPRFSIGMSLGSVLFPDPAGCGQVTDPIDNLFTTFNPLTDTNCTVWAYDAWNSLWLSGTWAYLVGYFTVETVQTVQIVQDWGPGTSRIDNVKVQGTTYHKGGKKGFTLS